MPAGNDMFNNPLIERYQHSALRPRHAWIYALIYLVSMALIVFLNWANARVGLRFTEQDEIGLLRELFGQFVIVECIILFIWGSSNVASALSTEMKQKSYDFLAMVPMTASDKILGIVIGRNLLTILLGGLNLVALVVIGILAHVPFETQMGIIGVIFSGTVCCWLVSLLSAMQVSKTTQGISPARLFVVVGFLVLLPLASSLVLGDNGEAFLTSTLGHFFVWQAPAATIITTCLIYFAFWVYWWCIRTLNSRNEPVSTARGALLFTIGFGIVMLGLFWFDMSGACMLDTHLKGDEALFTFGIVTLTPIFTLPFGTLQNYDTYVELGSRNPERTRMLNIVAESNLVLWMQLFVVWAVFVIAGQLCAKTFLEWRGIVYIIGMAGTFYAIYILLIEVCILEKPAYEKIHFLAGFVLLVQAILPVILKNLIQVDEIGAFSPLGLAFAVGERIDQGKQYVPFPGALTVNLLICLLLLLRVCRRYRDLVRTRVELSDKHISEVAK